MTEVAWGIMGTPATGMLNHEVNYFVEGLVYEYDPELSKECLAAAGKVINGLGPTGMAPDSCQDKFPEFCNNIGEALTTRDESVREQMYKEIQQFMYDHVINIPICETSYAIAYNNTIFADLDAYDVDTNVNPTRFTYVN